MSVDPTELPHLAIELIDKCVAIGMSHKQAMAFLIQTAEIAAELAAASTGECQEAFYVHACNTALKEYRKQSSAESFADGKFVMESPETLQ